MIGNMNHHIAPTDSDTLVQLIQQIKDHYQLPSPLPRKRGKQRDFASLSFLLLAVVALVTRTFRDSQLHQLLAHDATVVRAMEFVRLPHRTTIGRRLAALIPEAEAQIAALGKQIIDEVKPQPDQSHVSAIDGRMYQADGPLWHKSSRQADVIPVGLRNVDTDSTWSKSGYRGWVQGYRLVVQSLVFPAPVPIFAVWRPNNENEAKVAALALENQQMHVTQVLLGDTTFGGTEFTTAYKEAGGWVLTPAQLPPKRHTWKRDLYAYRKQTIELLFQRIIQASGLKECPVKGRGRNGAFALASVWLYQVCCLVNYRSGKPVAEIKDQVDCARWRIAA